MYEPWGYQEENNYQGGETILDNDLESFFAGTSYNKDDNKIYFTNKDGELKASLDVSEFVKSDTIIEKTEYKDGILKIYFTNGDIITIDLSELLDENEFKDGLIVDGHVIKVLIDSTGDPYLSVSEDGVKLDGVKAEIERLDDRIDEIISGSPVEQLDELIEKLGYKDNDTLVTTNEHEVAFGEWNISNTDVEASGQTVFSIGIGTSAHDRKNALEVRKDGGIYAWIEGEFMNINQLLGQISHEVYDTDSNP